MRALRRIAGGAAVLALATTLALVLWSAARGHPQDLPWTPLDLSQPVGMFTGRKLAALGGDFAACRELLDRAGVSYAALPPVRAGECGYDHAIRLTAGGARAIRFAPPGPGVACPVAAALAVWEWEVVQPAALRRFGVRVATVDHFGSYSCRRIYGRESGAWSEHAAANALDVAGFRLADGRRITVVGDWRGGGDKAAFLRDVRAGACRLFATVLGPDYNAAHRDHFHLDQATRGVLGWRACR